MSRRIRRFKSTLPIIREEKECDDHTTRKTISHHRKNTSNRHVACGICKKDHRLVTCVTYSAYNINKKYEAVIKHHYCVNCLARPNKTEGCTSKNRCSICHGQHHSSLHGHPRLYPINNVNGVEKPKSQPLAIETRLPSLLAKQTLVPILKIRLRCDGKWHKVRAILNPTLKITNIAAELVKKFKLPITYLIPNDTKFCLECNAVITHNLPKIPYKRDLSDDVKMRFEHLVLADPQFHSNKELTLEIGADIYPQIIRSGFFKPDNGTVVAQNTAFGWHHLTLNSARWPGCLIQTNTPLHYSHKLHKVIEA
ncbi:PREDICTED: uncharacterized protein LOC108969221 isoform X1 [Bactrocera latifrons]|uniref:uncharacterized protein LOC108969221 isoform X1 n=1 Tax=Bactrocera latifrons TaxID=174628 RepID=UPI0008DD7B44|nr:PREDICTED: uncharacterized protein LOC108969221 isoform X1 [Bactrocera latifrons]